MKITITEITDHERDRSAEMGDYGHMPDSEIIRQLADETERKIERGEWEGIPFTCEAVDGEDALDQYIKKYCEYDYIKPTDCECEEEN